MQMKWLTAIQTDQSNRPIKQANQTGKSNRKIKQANQNRQIKTGKSKQANQRGQSLTLHNIHYASFGNRALGIILVFGRSKTARTTSSINLANGLRAPTARLIVPPPCSGLWQARTKDRIACSGTGQATDRVCPDLW